MKDIKNLKKIIFKRVCNCGKEILSRTRWHAHKLKCNCAVAIKFKPGPKPVKKFMPQKINLNATKGGTREFTLFLEDPLPEANEIKD